MFLRIEAEPAALDCNDGTSGSADTERATIDWDTAADVAREVQCSRGERFLLQLACSLADPAKTVPMADISTLDGRNLKRVLEALRTAKFGW